MVHTINTLYPTAISNLNFIGHKAKKKHNIETSAIKIGLFIQIRANYLQPAVCFLSLTDLLPE